MNWKDESMYHPDVGNITIFRAKTDEGEWLISQSDPKIGDSKLARVSYGKIEERVYAGKSFLIASPMEIARFGSVEEAKIAIEIWENPGEIEPEEDMRKRMGFNEYIEGLEKREFSKSTDLLFSTKNDGMALMISAKNWQYIGLIYVKSPDLAGMSAFPGDNSLQDIRSINAKILCTLLELRLEHPYNRGKGIRTPVSPEQFEKWMDANSQELKHEIKM